MRCTCNQFAFSKARGRTQSWRTTEMRTKKNWPTNRNRHLLNASEQPWRTCMDTMTPSYLHLTSQLICLLSRSWITCWRTTVTSSFLVTSHFSMDSKATTKSTCTRIWKVRIVFLPFYKHFQTYDLKALRTIINHYFIRQNKRFPSPQGWLYFRSHS